MNKKVLVIVILIAAVVLASPWMIGGFAKDSVDRLFHRAAQEHDSVAVTAEAFRRGWFTSEGRHRIAISDALRNALGSNLREMPTLVIETRLDHGLIPLSSLTRKGGSLRPGLANAVSTLHIELHGGNTLPLPGQVYTRFQLGGGIASRYALEAGSYALDDSESVTWGDTTFEFTGDAADMSGEYGGMMESLQMAGLGMAVSMGKVMLDGSLEPSEFGMMTGDFRAEVEGIEVSDDAAAGSKTMVIEPIAVSAMTEVDDGLLNSSLEVSVAGVTTSDMDAGQKMNLDMALRVNGMQGDALAKLNEAGEEMGHDMFDGGAQAVMAALEPQLRQLVAAGFEIHLDRLNVGLPQGAVKSNLHLTMEEMDAADFNWLGVMLALRGEADMAIDAVLIDTAAIPELSMLAAGGEDVFLKNGDIYEARIEYAKGLLTINGSPMPLPLGR